MKRVLSISILLLCTNVLGATSSSVGNIGAVRVEGTTGLVTLPQSINDGTTECSRVWMDLTKDYDRAAYSTFLMAFASNMRVHIRAVENGTTRYGACDFYDVYIPKQ